MEVSDRHRGSVVQVRYRVKYKELTGVFVPHKQTNYTHLIRDLKDSDQMICSVVSVLRERHLEVLLRDDCDASNDGDSWGEMWRFEPG